MTAKEQYLRRGCGPLVLVPRARLELDFGRARVLTVAVVDDGDDDVCGGLDLAISPSSSRPLLPRLRL
jgi:hypothetical protein